MIKWSFFLILTLLSLTAGARSFLRGYEEFVHLSDAEKDQLIIKTMELSIELEARYKKEVAQHGFDQERFERYSKALKKFSNLILSSAYAVPVGKDWSGVAQDFIELLKKPDSRCIFAGWVSRPSKGANGQTVCSHPALLKGTPEQKAYLEASKGTTCGTNSSKMIQCSPAIFGYQNEGTKALFCVEASNGAHNSSYHCMKQALAVESQKGDSKDVRLKNLRERLSKNPEIFKGVQEFVYKTCVCEETDKSVNFNKDYHQYMRPHRTCYGLMEMMGETAICEDPKLPIDTSIFKSLKEFTRGKINSDNPTKAEEALADAHYKNFLTTEVMKSAPEEYNRLCSPKVPLTVNEKDDNDGDKDREKETPNKVEVKGNKLKYTCEASCKPSESTFTCTFKVTEEDPKTKESSVVELESMPKELPKADTEKTLAISTKIAGAKKELNLSCDLTFEKEKEKPEDKEKEKEKDPTLKIVAEKGDKSYHFKSIIENQGEWIFKWRFEGVSKDTKIPKGWEDPQGKPKPEEHKRKGLAKNDEEEESSEKLKEEKEKKEKEEKEKTQEKKPSDKLEMDQLRATTPFTICGELTKEGQKPITDCKVVEALDAPTQGPTAPVQQQPPMFRPRSDTSAIGIL
jgi:hypothetical protein